jgi:hypothetical protein
VPRLRTLEAHKEAVPSVGDAFGRAATTGACSCGARRRYVRWRRMRRRQSREVATDIEEKGSPDNEFDPRQSLNGQ